MGEDMNFDMGLPIVDLPQTNNCIIKVIGVGGGGGNAVNHMYREGIHDVSYVVCNTDKKALDDSPVPNRLQLGPGLGAGNMPEKARRIAEESIDAINTMLNDGTRMVFITAGMGGGTGTGAAPIIARCAKEAGILTVGIVTIPFKFEGMPKINQALDGVEEISKHVDALLVINNERLREIYPGLTVMNAFAKADDTLTVAAKSIAEIITMHGIMNLDFEDVTTVLKDGGVAIMSTGYGEGEGRVTKALTEALTSPLLNHNDIFNSKKVLLNINFCADDEHTSLMMEEMNEIHDFMGKFRQDGIGHRLHSRQQGKDHSSCHRIRSADYKRYEFLPRGKDWQTERRRQKETENPRRTYWHLLFRREQYLQASSQQHIHLHRREYGQRRYHLPRRCHSHMSSH